MMMSIDLLDTHGLLNVLEEDRVNVRYDRHSPTLSLVGATFNNILRSLFLLKSQSPNAMEEVLGGVECWEQVEESLMCTITTYSTVREVTQRVHFLVLMYLEDSRLIDITYGALRVLYLWAAYYSIFITDLQLTELSVGVEEMYRSKLTKSYCKCNKLCVDLREMLQELTAARSCSVFSATPRITGHNGLLDKTSVVVSTGPISPSVNFFEGSWIPGSITQTNDQHETDAAHTLARKDTICVPPSKIKFEMFGADAYFDDDSDATRSVSEQSVDEVPENSKEAVVTLPIPQINIGVNLLQDPRHLTMWSFDLLEIARQWTLIDQSLFRAIPLASFLSPTWSEPRHSPKSSPQLRKFIDRFNAESVWATATILDQGSAQRRADRYMQLIDLAGYLHDLNNYNGLMAIVSSLQQSSISRLKQTLALVSDSYNEKISKLQLLMSGRLNYRNYREDLGVRICAIPEFSVKALSATGEIVNQENTGGGNAFARRTSIVANKSVLSTAQPDSAEEEKPDIDPNACTGIVPHLAAHTAELTSIYDSNPEFIPDTPHLLNIEKKIMTSRAILFLARLQRSIYRLHSIRLVGSVINRSIQQYQAFSAAESSKTSTELYQLSFAREP